MKDTSYYLVLSSLHSSYRKLFPKNIQSCGYFGLGYHQPGYVFLLYMYANAFPLPSSLLEWKNLLDGRASVVNEQWKPVNTKILWRIFIQNRLLDSNSELLHYCNQKTTDKHYSIYHCNNFDIVMLDLKKNIYED